MTTINATTEDPLIGAKIDGRYTLHDTLGQGGMGVVYAGVHDELGRSVAIKVLNTAWASDRNAVERFLREARTASSFTHGNIVDVTDLGRLPDGRPYLVMPHIHGTDLATLLEDAGPQPAKRVAELLRGVASALDLIHARGFVHRDIKPENLMYVAREDGSETVMLLDFGIAALAMSNDRRLTGQGQVFGTPHYMAPESSTGAVPDARSDVYALATVAFELITGVLPFETDNLMQLLSMKLVNDAPSLSSVTGLAFPAALEAVIAHGLVRQPDRRYSSASELVDAIAGATQDAPVSWRSGVLRSNMHSGAHPLDEGRPDSQIPEARSDRSRTPNPAARRGTRSAPHPTHPSQGVVFDPAAARASTRPPTPGHSNAPSGRPGTPPQPHDSDPAARRRDTEYHDSVAPEGRWQDRVADRPSQRHPSSQPSARSEAARHARTPQPTAASGDWQSRVAGQAPRRDPTPARPDQPRRDPTPARPDQPRRDPTPARSDQPRRDPTPARSDQLRRDPTPARPDDWQDRPRRTSTPARGEGWQDHVAGRGTRPAPLPSEIDPLAQTDWRGHAVLPHARHENHERHERDEHWQEHVANPAAHDEWRAHSSLAPTGDENWQDRVARDAWREGEQRSSRSRHPSHPADYGSVRPAQRHGSGAPRYDQPAGALLGAGLRESESYTRRRQQQRARTRWVGLGVFAVLALGAALAIRVWEGARARDPANPQRELAANGVQQTPAAVGGVPAAIGGGQPGATARAHADDTARPAATPQAAAAASGSSNPARTELDPVASLTSARGEIGAAPSANPAPVFDRRTLPPPAAAPAAPKPAASRTKPEPQRAARPEPPAAPAPGSGSAPDLNLKPYVPEPPEAMSAPPVVVLKDNTSAPEPEAEPEPAAPDRAQVIQYTESATKALLRGEVNRAVELLREATRIAPDHAIAWRSLGLALERAGNANAALDAYQHYLSLVPTGAQSEMVRERMRALRQL